MLLKRHELSPTTGGSLKFCNRVSINPSTQSPPAGTGHLAQTSAQTSAPHRELGIFGGASAEERLLGRWSFGLAGILEPFPRTRGVGGVATSAGLGWSGAHPGTNDFFPRSDRHADNVRVKCTDPGISEYIRIMHLSVFPLLYIFVALVSQTIPLVVR